MGLESPPGLFPTFRNIAQAVGFTGFAGIPAKFTESCFKPVFEAIKTK
jgi:hypothetical protein